MFSASQHTGFSYSVAEQRIADLRRQATEHALAKVARAAAKSHKSTKSADRTPHADVTRAPRQAVVFIRASAHN